MTFVWTTLCFMIATSVSMMSTQANPSLDDIFIAPSATNITLGSVFAMNIDTNVAAFMTVTLIVVHPNGTVNMLGAIGGPPTFDLLPPNVPITAGNFTNQWNSTESSYCTTSPGLHGGLGYSPTVAGTYTLMPYVQYSYGTTGYSYKDGSVCINAPYIVETVPIANITLQVNPRDDGQKTLSSVPTASFDINSHATSSASLVAEPTGDQFTLPSSGIKRSGSGDIGLFLTLSLCVIASWIIRV